MRERRRRADRAPVDTPFVHPGTRSCSWRALVAGESIGPDFSGLALKGGDCLAIPVKLFVARYVIRRYALGPPEDGQNRSLPFPERLERAWEALPETASKTPSLRARSGEYHASSWPCGQQSRPKSGSTPTRDLRDEATHYEANGIDCGASSLG